jgi:hypothetical protein
MLKNITLEQLEKMLRRENPYWQESAYPMCAQRMKDTMDERLEEAVIAFAQDGTCMDVREGEFSISGIRKLKHCSFLDALFLMDDYMKNARLGRMRIMRR